jgi:hypothetical protein
VKPPPVTGAPPRRPLGRVYRVAMWVVSVIAVVEILEFWTGVSVPRSLLTGNCIFVIAFVYGELYPDRRRWFR